MKERKAELQKLIDFKKLKGANRKPRYATRKLSIGLVSCMLGFVLLVSPQSVEASEVANAPAATEAEPAKEEKPEGEAKPAGEEKTEAPVENKKTEAPTKVEKKEEAKPEVGQKAEPKAEPQAAPAKTEEKSAEKPAEENADDKAKAEKELADYKAEAIKKIEEAFNGFDEDVKPSKSLEDYKKDVEEADSKEAVDKLVEEAKAEGNTGLQKDETNKPEDSNQMAGEEKAITEDQKKKAGQSANNWDEKITEDNDYWKAPEGYNKAKNMGGTSGGGMGTNEVNYLGTYTDEQGRDVIRLEWKGDSRTSESVWMDQLSLAFKFQKDLYEKIDWDRSYVYSTSKGEQKFLFNNVNAADYQAEFMLSQVTGTYTGNMYELPMNLVLKEGYKLSDLGKKDYLVQHRGYDTKYKEILANYSGPVGTRNLNEVEYSQFTKSTVIPLNSNLHNDVIPANSNKESNRLSYGSSEYDSEKKVIKTKHFYRKSDSIDSYLGNVGFTQSFDARLLDLLKEDDQGNVAYLDVNGIDDKKAYTDTPKVGIKRNQINVKDGVATIYVVGSDFQSNLDKTGNKVVRATSGNIKTGIYSTLFKTATINFVNTTISYNVDEDMISKLFPQNKYLQAYAFQSGFIHENKDGFLKSEQEVKENTVIDKGSKLTLEFKDQMPDKGNKYVMQIGDTYHLMNDAAAPHRASDFETITERNGGGIGSSRNMKYDINMKAGRTLSAGEKIRLWIVNDNGHKYESQSWRLYINTGKAETDKDIVNVEGENFERDYNPYYFQHSKSVDGVMVTKYSYVPQVEEIFDTDTEIKGTVRRDQNDVTGYYMAPDGSKYYFSAVKSDDTDKARTIILDENGREVKEGDKNYENVFNYVLGTFKSEDGKENLKLKKDMPIYLNNSRKGQFPSDPVIEKVKARVTFDQNYEGKPEDKVVVAPENEQALGTAGYTANGLDYNGKNVMPKDPTREGYTFVGWAKTPDATKADFTKDTPIENSLTVYAVWKKTEITDNLTPAYTDADGKVGTQTTITSPNFTDKDGKDAAKPEGTKFALGKGAPEGATINPDTGEIKYTPTKDDAGKDVEIPVVVTYPDDSTDNVVAKVTVAPAQKDADKYEPEVKKEEIEKGGKVDLTDNVTNLDKLPEGTKVEDVTPEGTIDTNKPGDYTGKIKVTYPDGSSEEKDVPVTVKDTTPAEK
ncbi:Rib/alpha-like domain-containing protein, partial [Anaerococcus kampingiae]